jgi:gamma-glutamyltranspeptidase/glutathione hydrolase
MISAANPLAVQTGLRVLAAGGSAVDAAVAVQAVLGLVEPESSGLGGGSFMLFYDAKTKKVTAYDGREVAPKGADPKQFIGPDGKPLPFGTAVVGGIASGVPGAIAMLEMAQKEHGRLKWGQLFGEARKLAAGGFPVTPKLARNIVSNAPQAKGADAQAYFHKADGSPYLAGEKIVNKAYAHTLDLVAAQGAKGLLTGPVARHIVAKLTTGSLPSSMTLADLAAYRRARPRRCAAPIARISCARRRPLRAAFRCRRRWACWNTPTSPRAAQDPVAWMQIAQASRLAYADRDRYEGDPAFVRVPTGLLAPDYLAERAKLIGDTIQPVTYGVPKDAPKVGADATREPGGTTHMVIVDRAGNVVSMTTTVESLFGNGRMVDGFFLNNQLTDFSFSPQQTDGTAAANAVAPGKRPRSSMAPAIVLSPKGNFELAVGSPGGSSIIAYDLKALVALLDWNMARRPPSRCPIWWPMAIAWAQTLPRRSGGGAGRAGPVAGKRAGENSGLHAIVKRPDGYDGAADPRREAWRAGSEQQRAALPLRERRPFQSFGLISRAGGADRCGSGHHAAAGCAAARPRCFHAADQSCGHRRAGRWSLRCSPSRRSFAAGGAGAVMVALGGRTLAIARLAAAGAIAAWPGRRSPPAILAAGIIALATFAAPTAGHPRGGPRPAARRRACAGGGGQARGLLQEIGRQRQNGQLHAGQPLDGAQIRPLVLGHKAERHTIGPGARCGRCGAHIARPHWAVQS